VAVVKRHVVTDRFSGLRGALVGLQVNLLVLDALPEPFNEDVISPATFAVHADRNAVGFECLGKFQAGKLTALVAVHNLGPSVFGNRLIERCDAKVCVHGVGEPPRQDPAAGPVHDCYQVQKPSFHGQVSNIDCPDLVGPLNGKITKQIRIDLMPRVGLTGVGLAVDGRNTHLVHEPSHTAAPQSIKTRALQHVTEASESPQRGTPGAADQASA